MRLQTHSCHKIWTHLRVCFSLCQIRKNSVACMQNQMRFIWYQSYLHNFIIHHCWVSFFWSKLSSFNLMSSVFRSSFVSVCVFYIRTFVSIKMVCVELLCVNVCTCVRDDDYLQIVFTAIVRWNSCKNFVSLLPNLLPMHTLAQFLVVFSVQIHMCTQTVITKWKNANKFNNNITHLNRSKQKPIGSVCLVSGEM